MRQQSYADKDSDHRILSADLHISTKHTKGAGYWKLNTSILKDEEYKKYISNLITSEKEDIDNIQQRWDRIKLNIKFGTIEYCRKKGKERREKIKNLKEQQEREVDKEKKQDIEEKIEELEYERKSGVKIRSREKTLLNEDKPTKYFYLQEEVRQHKGIITEIHKMDENGDIKEVIEDQKEIMLELQKHHQKLYASQKTYENSRKLLMETVNVKLTEEQKKELEKPITKEELKFAIQSMEANKAPGPDGIPVEFYDTFLPFIDDMILEIMNRIYVQQEDQPYSQKRGYIKLVYKKGIKYLIINWRGITLLCADYKIMTKVMALRLKKVLPWIIIEDQTCAVPERSIYENLFIIRDIIAYSNHKELPTYIVAYDFQNAFDSVEHSYMIETLRRYNFGDNFRKFIENVYVDRKVYVMNNGHISLPVEIGRGLSQGDPLSLPLFCLMAEPLANLIRSSENIKGYYIPRVNNPKKILQYADDTNTVTMDKESVQGTLNTFQLFQQASGCSLHPDKLKGLAIQTDELPYTNVNITWNEPTGIKILGIYFMEDLMSSQTFNWTMLLKKIQKKMNYQKYRKLSLKGKIMILNSTILSKVWYLSTVFEMPQFAWSDKHGNGLKRMIFKFLWSNSNPEPIQRKVIYLPKEKGGLGLTHLVTQGRALRLKYAYKNPRQVQTKTWAQFARYWIGRRVQNVSEEWNFLGEHKEILYIQATEEDHTPYHYLKLLKDIRENIEYMTKGGQKSTKELYKNMRLTEDKKSVIMAEDLWKKALGKTITWKKVWKHVYASYNVGTTNDILYKILHNCLPTRTRMKMNRDKKDTDYSTKCKTCHKGDETTLHIFARCKHAADIWRAYRYLYQQYLPDIKFVYEEAVLTLNLQERVQEKKKKLIITITEIIIMELWNSRNKNEKENITPNRERSIKRINKKLTNIVTAHYQEYKWRNDVKGFEDKFAIDKVLCEIDYHQKLYLFLPP